MKKSYLFYGLAVLFTLGLLIFIFWNNETSEEKNKTSDVLKGKTIIQPVFNTDNQTVTLNDGNTMPIYGLGTYSLSGDTVKEAVKSALNQGYRLIDTAYMYSNEAEIGQAIEESGIPREDIFITTKIYPSQFDHPEEAIDQALERLGTDYIDLMLLHHPGDNDVKAYQALEQYQRDGKITSIGLSNYYVEELEAFLPRVEVMPALVQNEIHPYYQDQEVTDYIQSLGIVVEAWYPLGGRGYQEELLNDSTLEQIAQKYHKSVAQIILRWEQQRHIVTIPGSSNPDHQKENQDIFDFELTEAEMAAIAELEREEKHDWY
ncbi:aldo/keto reductase [Streptococcus chenjunshii]|uniref:Aldo/keto reductase n=1 Tax=Streptococcus chenjunshii TaxID=2173853 RepID=A0A372KPM7_9STRE|nr:aldo/keto reductase [Streptococcus chenjunshii]AXQ78474.1 aldo/keto reductase [Streptococcus chenjunshii]RFU52065.1 aldo/keto reductase [Streptococcus chenjunshii]RFU54257.1 aldo/keto reductase [Streptococcus chenjunshii]